MKWRRYGSPTEVRRATGLSEEERFWQYVTKTSGCWRWTGAKTHGYGNFYIRRDGKDRQVQAHRYAYELLVGPIPDGMTLDHACHTDMADQCRDGEQCPHRQCVRPEHLVPTSLSENIKLGGHGVRSTCKRGHPFTPENTGITNRGKGRFCRTCKRADGARLRERRRAAKTS